MPTTLTTILLAGSALLGGKAILATAASSSVAHSTYLEAADHESIYSRHSFCEQVVDLGEIRMNYAVAGSSSNPPLLLIPGQTESWWGYETAMWLLKDNYQVYAIDMRGQGRSTWTPGRYSLDNFGSDLVRFIDLVIQRPVVVSGLSSGGVMSAWLSAFAKPGQLLAAVYEDPPLFASETLPAVGNSVLQTVAGPFFQLWSKWLGGQWTIGDMDGMYAAEQDEMPAWITKYLGNSTSGPAGLDLALTEYDPDFGAAFASGTVGQSCRHEAMLTHVKVPVLFTHHLRAIDPDTGNLLGAISDVQTQYVQNLIAANGNQSFTLMQFPTQPHAMHSADPATYVDAITHWMADLGLGTALSPTQAQVNASVAQAAALVANKTCVCA
ncbi:alpha/beta-hydrolase [Thozetella sp. PMI_491]|nr:alpha/beta-hydrolase [Thozetella sp. PMI_491]